MPVKNNVISPAKKVATPADTCGVPNPKSLSQINSFPIAINANIEITIIKSVVNSFVPRTV